MNNLSKYIVEKLTINKNTTIDKRPIEFVTEYLVNTLHYEIDKDFSIEENPYKNYYYVIIDFSKSNLFDNFSFKQLEKNISNKFEENFKNVRFTHWFTFNSKEKIITLKIFYK